jgi:hypothetical protein
VTADEYCRHIEAYLCRKNDGHLIRIVGPSFERVCGWAEQGIPFKIACQGIDRYFERYYAKASRRRPVQIDFCEHDVLDAFDGWRRAVGVAAHGPDAIADDAHPRQRRSLPRHLDRVCELIAIRRTAAVPPTPGLDAVFEDIAAQAAEFRDRPGSLRGDLRETVTSRLNELDRLMLQAAREGAAPDFLRALHAEATEQLRPFHDRMRPEAYRRAVEAAVDRLLREREQLPTVAFD